MFEFYYKTKTKKGNNMQHCGNIVLHDFYLNFISNISVFSRWSSLFSAYLTRFVVAIAAVLATMGLKDFSVLFFYFCCSDKLTSQITSHQFLSSKFERNYYSTKFRIWRSLKNWILTQMKKNIFEWEHP